MLQLQMEYRSGYTMTETTVSFVEGEGSSNLHVAYLYPEFSSVVHVMKPAGPL
jgi:hypothetical protein